MVAGIFYRIPLYRGWSQSLILIFAPTLLTCCWNDYVAGRCGPPELLELEPELPRHPVGWSYEAHPPPFARQGGEGRRARLLEDAIAAPGA